MKRNRDILGTAIKSFYFEGDRSKLWVFSDKLVKDEMPLDYFFRDFDKMPELERIALESCKGKVLDVGAGTGSHALWLQNKKFNITAIDHSSGCVEVMRKRGVKLAVNSDFYDFNETGFDTILLLMNGIGLSKSLDELPAFLEHIKNMITENGQILFDSSDLKYLYLEEDGSMMIDLNAPYYGEINFRYTYKKQVGHWFKWLYIGEQLMSDFAEKAKLKMTVLFRGDNSDYLARLTRMK